MGNFQAKEPPPPVVLVPPLFDFPPLSARTRYILFFSDLNREISSSFYINWSIAWNWLFWFRKFRDLYINAYVLCYLVNDRVLIYVFNVRIWYTYECFGNVYLLSFEFVIIVKFRAVSMHIDPGGSNFGILWLEFVVWFWKFSALYISVYVLCYWENVSVPVHVYSVGCFFWCLNLVALFDICVMISDFDVHMIWVY